jgi:hypothetical protein
MVGSFHRIHSIRSLAVPAVTCRASSATDQIGCLVQASPCSIGFAGRSAVIAGTVALNLDGSPPADICIQNRTYPLQRKLYLNTVDGFGALGGDHARLAACFATQAPAVATALGFVPLGGPVCCEDYDEAQTGCPGVVNSNACAGNPPPIPDAFCP